MPFQKGNKLSAKGRPVGSKNKINKCGEVRAAPDVIQYIRYEKRHQTLDAYKKFDIRMKAMSYFFSRLAIDMTVQSKPWADLKFITEDGKDLPEEEKKRIYFEAGGDGTNPVDLPLFLD